MNSAKTSLTSYPHQVSMDTTLASVASALQIKSDNAMKPDPVEHNDFHPTITPSDEYIEAGYDSFNKIN